jgi:mycothiol synthase
MPAPRAQTEGAPLPPLPAGTPPGWVAREPTADDAPATFRLVADCDIAVLGRPDIALGDVAADLGLDPHWQTVVVDPAPDGDVDGERVRAWAWMLDTAAGRSQADVYVDPALPSEAGDALAAWCWQVVLPRAAQMAARRGVPSTTVEVGSLDGDEATRRRLAAGGFDRARTFWRMRRELGPNDADGRPAPGVVVRAVGQEEVRRVHELIESAFQDHWGHHRREFDDWWRQVSTTYGFDLDLWWLAELDGVPVGTLLGTSQMAEEDAIFISWLGTLSSARGRGVAKSLLRKAFAAGLERGWSQAQLGVDSDSPTSAPQLYSSVGMTVSFAMHAWQLEVPAAAG